MTNNWSFAEITDILLKKNEVSDRRSKSLSQQNLRCPSPSKGGKATKRNVLARL